MWTDFDILEDDLKLKKVLVDKLLRRWPLHKRQSILSPRQEIINRSLVEVAIKKEVPTLIICNSPERYSEWEDALSYYIGEDRIKDVIGELNILEDHKLFQLTSYSTFCNESKATEKHRDKASQYWKNDLACVGASPDFTTKIIDMDSTNDAEHFLKFEEQNNDKDFKREILRFIDLEREGEKFSDEWLNEDFDAIINYVQKAGIELIICDESHEVTGIWAEALSHLFVELHSCRVISMSPLKAMTSLLSPRDFQLQNLLFDTHPIKAHLSLMVKDNCFKAYRGMVVLASPTDSELKFLHQLSDDLHEVMAKLENDKEVSLTLIQFAKDELQFLSGDIPGNWAHRFEYMESVLNYLYEHGVDMPSCWDIFLDQMKEVSFHKNLPLIREYIYRVLKTSVHPNEVKLAKDLVAAFRPLGYDIFEFHIRKSRSIVPNIISRSESKEIKLVEMLGHEFSKLKQKLRAVVICDFLDRSVASEIFPGMKFNDRSGSMLAVLDKLEKDSLTKPMNSVVVSENKMYYHSHFNDKIVQEIEQYLDVYGNGEELVYDDGGGVSSMTVKGSHTVKSLWIGFLNRLLEDEVVNCLIVGREFLTHKWDGISFNTYCNLSSAHSDLFSIRLLARLLDRGDDPVDAKHLWDFCCVMPQMEYGMIDYQRMVDRKVFGYHLCEDGEFEQGINYFHPYLKKAMINLPDSLIAEVNETAVRLVDQRDKIKPYWVARHDHENVVRDVLEIAMPRGMDFSSEYVLSQVITKKVHNAFVDPFQLINMMTEAIVEAMRRCKMIDHQVEMKLTIRKEGVYRFEVLDSDPETCNKVLDAVMQLYSPIHHQHYVVNLSFGKEAPKKPLFRFFASPHLDYVVPLAIPDCFGKKVELAQFLHVWQEKVSRSQLMAHRNFQAREEVRDILQNQQCLVRPNVRKCSLLI